MNNNQKLNCVVICGPTATGKTSLAVKTAVDFNGEILSADSRQVYRGMDIGSGKDLDQYEYFINDQKVKIPYHLIDIVDPDEIYSLYKYLENFYDAFNVIMKKGKLPIIEGGTGLYIEAALKKYKIANVPEDSVFRKKMMDRENEYLIELLKQFPEIYEKTDLSSKKRIVRSLEIAEYSKKAIVEYSSTDAPDIFPLVFQIVEEKENIDKLIDLRLDKRFENGMVEEVENLITEGVSKERLYMLGLEYRYISMYLFKEISYEEMYESLKNEIHRFAKRQATWFRGMKRRGINTIEIKPGEYDTIKQQLQEILIPGQWR